MNKFIKLFCGAAAATMMFSCSSDEPANTPDNGNVSADGVAYLAVNIKDANASRALADNIEDANEGDYIYGDEDEHAVANAHFYFYDKDGIFVTEANVWTGGDKGDTENIEFIGNNVLVLRNLKQDNLPVYLVTVLNVPTDFKPSPRLEDMAKQQLKSYLSGNNFIMSTTSFVNDGNNDNYEAKDKKLYFANKLKPTDFLKEPIDNTQLASVPKVDIYVERLAAKFTLSGLTNGVYEVPVTVAGKPNGPIEEDSNVGATKMYIKFDGWGVNATEPTSYLSKNLDLFSNGGPINDWTDWNKSDYFRSFWGQSVQYGKTPVLDYTSWSMAAKVPVTQALYSFECTNQPEYIAKGMNVITKNVTHLVLAATVYNSAAATEDDAETLVLYNGVYFQEAQFLKYVLNSLQKAGQLNYYIQTSETEIPVEGYTPTIEKGYRQISLSEVQIVKKDRNDGGTTGEIIVKSNIPAGTKLYSKDGENFVELANADELNKLLAGFTASVPATGYKDGKMVYYIPVEHLLDIIEGQKEIVEGNYGVVRNHWYDIHINSVFRLGEGVFEPGTGSENDPGEPLIPENPNGDTFGLGARVNILSWKIVKQNVDL